MGQGVIVSSIGSSMSSSLVSSLGMGSSLVSYTGTFIGSSIGRFMGSAMCTPKIRSVVGALSYVRIYLSALVLLACILCEFLVQPFKFRTNNFVDKVQDWGAEVVVRQLR